jgi:hypothetical protein
MIHAGRLPQGPPHLPARPQRVRFFPADADPVITVIAEGLFRGLHYLVDARAERPDPARRWSARSGAAGRRAPCLRGGDAHPGPAPLPRPLERTTASARGDRGLLTPARRHRRVDGSSHLPRRRHPMVREHCGPPRTGGIVVFAALRFATARRLRTLGVVQRMRSSVNVLGHVVARLLGSAYLVARPVHGQGHARLPSGRTAARCVRRGGAV